MKVQGYEAFYKNYFDNPCSSKIDTIVVVISSSSLVNLFIQFVPLCCNHWTDLDVRSSFKVWIPLFSSTFCFTD